MIGYAELLEHRLRGYKPNEVWLIVCGEQPPPWLKQDARDSIANNFMVTMLILPNQSIASLDLSALLGLTVHVFAKNTPRSHEIIKVCRRYAERVIHCLDGHLIILRGINAEQT